MPGLPYLRNSSIDNFTINIILLLLVLEYGNVSHKSRKRNSGTFYFEASCAINGKLEIPRGNPTPSRSLPISFRKVLFLYPEWIVCRSQSSQLSSKMCSLSLRGYEQPQDEMPAPLIAIHVHNCISVDSIMYVGLE